MGSTLHEPCRRTHMRRRHRTTARVERLGSLRRTAEDLEPLLEKAVAQGACVGEPGAVLYTPRPPAPWRIEQIDVGGEIDDPARVQPQNRTFLTRPGVLSAIALGLFSWLGSGCASAPGGAPHSAVAPGISVSGHGEARGVPDIARITLGVETRAPRADEATEQANQQMAAVILALHQSGVTEADVRTQNFSINFEQQPEPYPPVPSSGPERVERTEAGKGAAPAESPRGFYRASNTVLVSVRDLDNLGAVLGAATRAGANAVWGIEFEIEDPSQLEAAARQKAMTEAKARAEQLAALAGVKLGRIVSVGELGGGAPSRSGFGFDMKSAQADVPVQRGELTVSQDVQLVFSIE